MAKVIKASGGATVRLSDLDLLSDLTPEQLVARVANQPEGVL